MTPADVQRVAREWLAPESAVTFSYTQGSGDPATYANPSPMASFATVPPAIGEPAKLNDEVSRQAPPPPGAVPAVARAEIVESSLANGVRLVAAQTGSVPLATMTVVLPGGTATDPVGKSGTAELAAALADKGTASRSAEQIAAALESLGANMSATTGPDGVVFSLTAPAANLAAAGEVLADVITTATYPADELERERARIVDSLKVALKDPGSLAGLIAPRLFYGAAPYASVATIDSLPAIAREDLVAWRAATWHPATAQIVVSGGIAPAEAQRIAGALFGAWTNPAPAPRPVARPAGEALAPRTVVIDMPEAGQAAVLAGVARYLAAGPTITRSCSPTACSGWVRTDVCSKRCAPGAASATAPTARSPRAPTPRCFRRARRPRTPRPTRSCK